MSTSSAVMQTPQISGRPNSRLSAMAAPITSARSQAAIAISQSTHSTMRDRPRVAVAARLREVASAADAEPHRERLQQDRHQVRDQDHAEQRVAVARAAGEVGGPVARVHVADRHQVARAGKREQLPPETGVVRHGDRAVDLAQAGRVGRRSASRAAGARVLKSARKPFDSSDILISQNYIVADIKSQVTLPASNMLPSSTVENYLKAIYHGRQRAWRRPSGCCRWASSPSALGVAPGTATTMVKTLAESGLVEYEPYAGVALTAGRAEARRARAPPPSSRRAVPRAGDGLRVGRGARRGRAARARRLRSADRSHGRDARTARDRSARRPDSRRRRPGEAAGGADAAHVPARHAGHRDARDRSGQGVPALHRAAPPQAGRSDRGRRRATPPPTACACAARTISASRSARGRRRSCWCRCAHGRCCCCLLALRRRSRRTATAQQPTRARAPTSRATWTSTSTSRSSRTARSTSTASCCSSRTRSRDRIRFVGELELEHAFVEGLEEAGELELEQAYVDFLLVARVQRPRRACC